MGIPRSEMLNQVQDDGGEAYRCPIKLAAAKVALVYGHVPTTVSHS
jgi:hypothetical protein